MKKALSLILCLVMAFGLTACGDTAKEETTTSSTKTETTTSTDTQTITPVEQGEKVETSTHDTVRIAVDGDCGSLDPFTVSGNGYLMAMYAYAEPLWVYDGTGNVDYLLCESVETVSDTEYLVHLRQGVTFSNGSAFNADDVMFTWDYVINESKGSAKYSFLSFDWEKTEKVDDYTVRIVLTKADATQLPILSDICYIDAETYDAETSGKNPIGTGPYTVESYIVNSELVLKARDDYWGGKPAIENIVFKNIAEPSQKINAFEASEVDFILSIPSTDIEYIQSMDNVNVIQKASASNIVLTMNGKEDSPLATKEARWAVAYATNRAGMASVAYSNTATVSTCAFGVGCTDYNDGLANLHDTYATGYNMDLAKQYAEESGLVGQTVRIVTNGSDAFVSIAQILEQSLKELGVDAQVINYDQATVRNLISGPDDWEIWVTNMAGSSCMGIDLLYAQSFKFNRDHFEWKEELFNDMKAQGETILATSDSALYDELALKFLTQYEEECYVYGICDLQTYRAAKSFIGGIATDGNAHDRVGEWYFTE